MFLCVIELKLKSFLYKFVFSFTRIVTIWHSLDKSNQYLVKKFMGTHLVITHSGLQQLPLSPLQLACLALYKWSNTLPLAYATFVGEVSKFFVTL